MDSPNVSASGRMYCYEEYDRALEEKRLEDGQQAAAPAATFVSSCENSIISTAAKACIATLSNEIIVEILKDVLLLVDYEASPYPTRQRVAVPLLQVSKRFYHIMLPLIYTEIQLARHKVAPSCLTV